MNGGKRELCLLCGRPADQTQKDESLMNLCNNCIVNIKREAKTKLINNKLQIKLQQAIELLNEIKDLYETIKIMTRNPVNKKKTVNNTPQSRMHLAFKGREDSLRNMHTVPHNLKCNFCQLTIDPKLYFYPIIILECEHEYYHQECFAKLMATGQNKCQTCGAPFFKMEF